MDEHGWVFPFGDYKPIRAFLEYYFDHTALVGADDPRLDQIKAANEGTNLFNLRVLPYGVSMEMSSFFIWTMVQAYVFFLTKGRVSVVGVESREHGNNASSFSMTKDEARAFVLGANQLMGSAVRQIMDSLTDEQVKERAHLCLIKRPEWPFMKPFDAVDQLYEVISTGEEFLWV